MNIDFSESEALFLYGYFKKEINKLEKLKSNPNHDIAISNINSDIKLYKSIADKIAKAYPSLLKLDDFV